MRKPNGQHNKALKNSVEELIHATAIPWVYDDSRKTGSKPSEASGDMAELTTDPIVLVSLRFCHSLKQEAVEHEMADSTTIQAKRWYSLGPLMAPTKTVIHRCYETH